MMDREWAAILARYGQTVTVRRKTDEAAVELRAFLQPVREKGQEQAVPSPLGLRAEERLLYLGPRDVTLDDRESLVTWAERDYVVQSAHPVGDSHWWAVLRPRDEVSA